MKFIELPLSGAFLLEPDEYADVRGNFTRTWCRREFQENGLTDAFVQCSLSFSHKKGTLRGMHYQAPPYQEEKLIRCTRGSIHDVLIDLRHESSTFMQWYGVKLTAENRWSLYAPKGFAHGFLTLEKNSEVFYQMSEFYQPESARGVRWNDPAFGIEWPSEVSVIIDRDRDYPNFESN